MLFRKSKTSSETKNALQPFVLRTEKGFIIGQAMDPGAGSPCLSCVRSWLAQKGIGTTPMEPAAFPLRADLWQELERANSPHLMFEVAADGTSLRLDGPVFPYRHCSCEKAGFPEVGDWAKRSSFLCSPINHMESVRFPTSEGNLWITDVSGRSLTAEAQVFAQGAADTKEKSRAHAVDLWLKRASLADLTPRSLVPSVCFQRPLEPFPFKELEGKSIIESAGIGVDAVSAQLDALYGLARKTVVNRYSHIGKQPLLVVGITNWLRARVPLFVLQRYDFHLLFYPNSFSAWVVGVIAVSRQDTSESPTFTFSAHAKIHRAIDDALGQAVASCAARPEPGTIRSVSNASSLALWWTHWIYRCSKLSLRDMLHLEPYEESVELWREYFRDGQGPVQQQSLNHADLPVSLRHLVLMRSPEESRGGKVIGLASWVSSRAKRD